VSIRSRFDWRFPPRRIDHCDAVQVARNFFLSQEKTLKRKLAEIFPAYRIEAALSKDQIPELYMNQIYLGQRTHGFAGAARTYFNKPLQDLTLAEAAILAGIPQNPAKQNPAVNPLRAKMRQELVRKRLLYLGTHFVSNVRWLENCCGSE